jgi:hypothetical protein
MNDTIEDKIKEFREKKIYLETQSHMEDWLYSALLSQQKEFKEALGEMEIGDFAPIKTMALLGMTEEDLLHDIEVRNELRKEVLTKIESNH